MIWTCLNSAHLHVSAPLVVSRRKSLNVVPPPHKQLGVHRRRRLHLLETRRQRCGAHPQMRKQVVHYAFF